MNRTPVSSSNLVSVGYDEPSAVLEVEFHSGSVYQYFQVPRFEFDSLMAASSHGSYFSKRIRNSFRYNRIR